MPTQSELRSAIQEARGRFDAAVAGVDTETLENKAICGVWSARDVAGHLLDWNDELLAVVEYETGRVEERRPLIEDGEAFNASHAAARKSQSWSSVRAELDASFDRAESLLAEVDDAQLAQPAAYPWGAVDTVGGVFYGVPHHTGEHLEDLEQHLRA